MFIFVHTVLKKVKPILFGKCLKNQVYLLCIPSPYYPIPCHCSDFSVARRSSRPPTYRLRRNRQVSTPKGTSGNEGENLKHIFCRRCRWSCIHASVPSHLHSALSKVGSLTGLQLTVVLVPKGPVGCPVSEGVLLSMGGPG